MPPPPYITSFGRGKQRPCGKGARGVRRGREPAAFPARLRFALAATRPDLVRRLVFFGTYASAAEVFIRPDLNATLIALVRSHWGLGSKLLAGLYRPDLTDAAANHMIAVLETRPTVTWPPDISRPSTPPTPPGS